MTFKTGLKIKTCWWGFLYHKDGKIMFNSMLNSVAMNGFIVLIVIFYPIVLYGNT